MKVVLLGESGVGKTSIISQFTSGKFNPRCPTSVSAQFISKQIKFPKYNKILKFDIWDTVGQEKYRSLAKIFYKDAKAVILVYDVTNENSFTQLKEYWYEQIKQLGDKDIILAIAANKNDLYDERVVESETGEEFARSVGAIFMSTSAKDDNGITALFDNIGQKILDPNFDFSANEKKKKDAYKKQKQKEAEQENKPAASNKGVKLNAPKPKEKKKGGC